MASFGAQWPENLNELRRRGGKAETKTISSDANEKTPKTPAKRTHTCAVMCALRERRLLLSFFFSIYLSRLEKKNDIEITLDYDDIYDDRPQLDQVFCSAYFCGCVSTHPYIPFCEFRLPDGYGGIAMISKLCSALLSYFPSLSLAAFSCAPFHFAPTLSFSNLSSAEFPAAQRFSITRNCQKKKKTRSKKIYECAQLIRCYPRVCDRGLHLEFAK